VGGGAARSMGLRQRTDRLAPSSAGPSAPEISDQGKKPRSAFLPTLKKVVGSYESSTVVEREDAVNRKFARLGASWHELFLWIFDGGKGFFWGAVEGGMAGDVGDLE